MDNFKEELEALAARSGKSKKAAGDGAELLSKTFSENRDCAAAAELLMKFHYSVCPMFLNKAALSSDEARRLCRELVPEKPHGKNSFCRGFAVCRRLLENGAEKTAVEAAAEILRRGQVQGGFCAGLISDFNKIFGEEQRGSFFRAGGSFGIEIISAFEPACRTEKSAVKSARVPSAETARLAEENRRLAAQVDRLVDVNGIVNALKMALDSDRALIAAKDAEIERLGRGAQNVSEAEKRLAEANVQIDEANERIADLNARLAQAFKMDEMNKNTELLTLKKNVSDALKEEYAEFKSCGQTFSEDNFQANCASLFRIFKILKRFGFSLE